MAPKKASRSRPARSKTGGAPQRVAEQPEVYLEQLLGLRPDRIACATPSPDGRTLLVRFGDNRNYALRLEDIEDFDAPAITEARTDMDGAEVVVAGRSGRKATIPWDYILYKCEPGYAASMPRSHRREPSPRAIGRRIRQFREERGLDISTFARLSGLARPNVHRLEGGLHRPQMETLAKAAKALGIAITDLLREK
jgi:DNA-binding XRE family transcriptional regulator